MLASRWAAGAIVAVLLAAFFALAVTSIRHKCATSDEVVHLLAGASYWQLDDYRIDPENGNLPQRWMALPLLVAGVELPSYDDHPELSQWTHAQRFFYEMGNDPDRMLLAGRVMIALLAVVLGGLVYFWSARLFGRGGGLISLTLYCCSTVVLANGRLATSDLTVALLFLASVGCMWRAMHRLTPLTVLASAIVMGLLFVAKMSAVLIGPMAVALVAIRLIRRQPLVVSAGRSVRREVGRLGQVGWMAGAAAVHLLVVAAVIWASFGFRYAAVRPDLAGQEQMDAAWDRALANSFPLRGAIEFAREHHLLPEAYLYGQANVLGHATLGHAAYAAGHYSTTGWWWFFPYCFLIKTSLVLPAMLVLAAAAAVLGWRGRPAGKGRGWPLRLWRGFYRTAPLWVLLTVYWAAAVASSINIGHRHILPTYPPLFILAGSAVGLWSARRHVAWRWAVGVLLAAYVVEAVSTWPNYLAYFNQLVGGSKNGYRCLVDSSLDWGQDVPGLKRWLAARGLNDPDAATPVYLSYFGTGSPTYYGVRAQRLPGYADADLGRSPPVPIALKGGYYCISASMLPMVVVEPSRRWSEHWEQEYQRMCDWYEAFMAQPVAARLEEVRADGREFGLRMKNFALLRLGRLMALLRQREPVDEVGHSILIYHLSDEEAARAADPDQPPAELVPDEVDHWDKLHAD